MRLLIALPLLFAATACNVSKDGNQVTVQYDQNTAENAVADVSNTAQNIGADISNDVQKTGDKLDNKIGDGKDSSDDHPTTDNSAANTQ